jgi:phosphoribosylanthranilate isomerase
MRTRIKICGITREADAMAAGAAGVDAVGFVFYAPSPRAVTPARASELAAVVAPFVSRVGLFVDPEPATVASALATGAIHVLQFHGDEPPAFCASFGVPWIKAARVRPGLDLLEFAARYRGADGLLCDAFVEGYGGAGKTFDWSLIPPALPRPLILSGGLDEHNVGEAIRRLRPAAVDVSSGVEAGKGIKDAARIHAFVEKVRQADEALRSS